MMLAFGGLFLLNLLLRVFYIRYDFVNGDEGVRALTAVRMLEGARLYADVVTDKPPGASLFYAAVFTMFGRSMKAVHLAATVWNFGTSLIVFLIASRFCNRRIGLWAALLFVYFSTNYFTQDMMAANTELLMALPYAAAFYFFMVASERKAGSRNALLFSGARLVAAGLLTGAAALFKQIGVLNLVFFALYEVLAAWKAREKRVEDSTWLMASIRRVVARLSLIAVGFTLVLAAFVLWLESMGALRDFWRNGVVLNMFYIDSEPFGLWMKFMLGRGLGYVFFNAVLWSLAGWAVWRSIQELKGGRKDAVDDARSAAYPRFDVAAALWCGVSLVAVIMSGRFYGHYFIPSLPALSLLGARGLSSFAEALRTPVYRRRAQVTGAVLALLFLIGFFRCHHRTAVLAYETVRGTRTRWSADWGMTKREQEADVVSQYVRERVPAGEPLYIWGYAHDVFWRTRCRPASRYLTPYYIDGRFSDAEATVPSSGEEFRREAAANLIEDLRSSKPPLILDVEGNFKALPHPELVEFIEKNYRDAGRAGPDAARPFRAFELKGELQPTEIEGPGER
ncbi:MAG TPA: glycosyltransferase family 39 protein [Blastocatellia bacterium]|nr:glycosyltransferase family 39 protein [Blastocatellia bacterium]